MSESPEKRELIEAMEDCWSPALEERDEFLDNLEEHMGITLPIDGYGSFWDKTVKRWED
jgi:hypothetical protein